MNCGAVFNHQAAIDSGEDFKPRYVDRETLAHILEEEVSDELWESLPDAKQNKTNFSRHPGGCTSISAICSICMLHKSLGRFEGWDVIGIAIGFVVYGIFYWLDRRADKRHRREVLLFLAEHDKKLADRTTKELADIRQSRLNLINEASKHL